MRAKIENPVRLSTVVGLVDRWQAAGVRALSDALGIRAYEQSDLRPRRFAKGHPNHTAAQRLSSTMRRSERLRLSLNPGWFASACQRSYMEAVNFGKPR